MLTDSNLHLKTAKTRAQQNQFQEKRTYGEKNEHLRITYKIGSSKEFFFLLF